MPKILPLITPQVRFFHEGGLTHLAFIGALVLGVPAATGQQLESRPNQHPLITTTGGNSAQKTASIELRIAIGLTANLWADESLLSNPVAISFDHLGRVYVAETHRLGSNARKLSDDSNFAERDLASRTLDDHRDLLQQMLGERHEQLAAESERVRLIEDTNRDGVADRGVTVVEGFDGPVRGVLADRENVWLAASPSLWRFAPPSAAQKAASPEELLRGFGVHVGSPTHGVRGVVMGPDGRLYFCVGDRGAQIVTKEGRTLGNPDSGAIFRCATDGTGLELLANGFRNPHDLAFDELGNLFAVEGERGTNDQAHLVHVIEGGDSGWRFGHEYPSRLGGGGSSKFDSSEPRSLGQPAHFVPPVAVLERSALGVAFAPANVLVADVAAALLVCHRGADTASSGIEVYKIAARGAGFAVMENRPLLRDMLATDLTFGPDSRLYVSDWVSRWPWPQSDRGRIFVVDAADVPEAARVERSKSRELIEQGMEGRSSEELVGLLGHADQRVRLPAQFALAKRSGENLAAFVALAENTAAPRLARIHALWGAGQLAPSVPAALNHLPPLLRDGDAEVRAQAAKMLGDYSRFESFRFLVTALQDPAPRVVFFAAQSLGKLKRPEAIPPLIEVLRRNDEKDVSLTHAVIHALAQLGPDPALEKMVRDPSRAVRLGGVGVYRRLGDASIASFLQDFDPDIVREAAFAIHDTPIDAAMRDLAALLETAPLDERALMLRAINAQFRLGQPENAQSLAAFAGRSYVPASLRAEAIDCLGAWATPTTRDRLTGLHHPLAARAAAPAQEAVMEVLSHLSGHEPEAVQVATIRAVAALKIPGRGHAFWDVVYQEGHPVAARIAALHALETTSDLRLEVAAQHAGRSADPDLRRAAFRVLARLHPGVALPVFRDWIAKGDADDLKILFPLLSEISDPRSDALLADALHRLERGEIPAAAVVELLEAVTAREGSNVAAALQQVEATWRSSGDRLAPFRSALAGGDSNQGRLLFERHPRLACIQCHEQTGQGSASEVSVDLLTRDVSIEGLLEVVVSAKDHCHLTDEASTLLSRRELRDLMSYLSDMKRRADAAATAASGGQMKRIRVSQPAAASGRVD